ncbi:DUF6498-containing protein [Haloferax marisrubri]|uniref:Uncharacterized protein n=1 Tax=Haloferax marisrubri TaxID=1544719 RepID=A0A2P4NMQ0_9EURY|nr:DUF6498-containing protein [Haloferax marisrubri]POG54442.1 hypothetical protein AUR65_016880 [Haloferax marisrubri]
MSPPRYGDVPTSSLPAGIGFLPVLSANLLPLAGVLWFGWNPGTLLAVYVLELLLLFPLSGVKALFAGRPPTSSRKGGVFSLSESDLVGKRGSVSIHDRLPPVYPRNVPFATAVVVGGAWVGVFLLAPLSEVVSVLDVLARPEAVVSVAALVVGQIGETASTFLRRNRYAERSPYALVEIPARQAMFLACFLFVVILGGATVALAGFVFVKLLFEWSGFHAEQGGGRLTSWLSGPDSDATRDEIDVPDGHPSAAIDADRRAVVAAAVWRAVTTTGPFYVTMAAMVWIGGTAFVAEEASLAVWVGFGVFGLALLAFMLAGDVVEDTLASGWLTYRQFGGRLVAHDRLTGEPQWVATVGDLRDAEVVATRPTDRYLGTRGIAATVGWGDDETERTLGPVADAEGFVERFDLPIESTTLSPLDRRFVGGAVASVVLTAVGVVTVVLTPLGPSTSWLLALFLFPVFAIAPKGFWKLAHS